MCHGDAGVIRSHGIRRTGRGSPLWPNCIAWGVFGDHAARSGMFVLFRAVVRLVRILRRQCRRRPMPPSQLPDNRNTPRRPASPGMRNKHSPALLSPRLMPLQLPRRRKRRHRSKVPPSARSKARMSISSRRFGIRRSRIRRRRRAIQANVPIRAAPDTPSNRLWALRTAQIRRNSARMFRTRRALTAHRGNLIRRRRSPLTLLRRPSRTTRHLRLSRLMLRDPVSKATRRRRLNKLTARPQPLPRLPPSLTTPNSLPYPKQSLADVFRGSTETQTVPRPPSTYTASGQPYTPPQGQGAVASAPPANANPTNSLPYPKQSLFDIFSSK